MISNSIAVTVNLSYYRTFVPLILQVYLSMDLADMTLLKAYWVTAGLWHRVQHWPWNRHSWRRYVQVLTKKSKQTRKQKVKKKRKKTNGNLLKQTSFKLASGNESKDNG